MIKVGQLLVPGGGIIFERVIGIPPVSFPRLFTPLRTAPTSHNEYYRRSYKAVMQSNSTSNSRSPLHGGGVAMPRRNDNSTGGAQQQAGLVQDARPSSEYGISNQYLPTPPDLEQGGDLESGAAAGGAIELRPSTRESQQQQQGRGRGAEEEKQAVADPAVKAAVQFYRAVFAEQAPEWCLQYCCSCCCPSAGGGGGRRCVVAAGGTVVRLRAGGDGVCGDL